MQEHIVRNNLIKHFLCNMNMWSLILYNHLWTKLCVIQYAVST